MPLWMRSWGNRTRDVQQLPDDATFYEPLREPYLLMLEIPPWTKRASVVGDASSLRSPHASIIARTLYPAALASSGSWPRHDQRVSGRCRVRKAKR